MDFNAAVTGWGHYSPAQVMSNHDLKKLVETDDAWIQSRTGIRERRIAAPGETTSTMATIASKQALKQAELSALDIDLVICATTTPDQLVPATACLIQHHIGAHRAPLLTELRLHGLYLRDCNRPAVHSRRRRQQVLSLPAKLSRFVDRKTARRASRLGDGAAAFCSKPLPKQRRLSTVLGSRGDVAHMLTIEAGGCAGPRRETVAEKAHCIRMRNEIFKVAVRSMAHSALEALAKVGLTTADVRICIPRKPTRILTATQEAMD